MTVRALLAGAWIVLAAPAAAQERQRCTVDGAQQTNIQLPSGNYNSFIGGGVVVRCPAKSLTLRSDSLEQYGDEGRIYLLRNVRYQEPRLDLTSDFLTYFQNDERIVANGNVDAKLPSGSTLRGPHAEYFRAIPGSRPDPRLAASSRPVITIVQKDSAGNPAPPTSVTANHVLMIGDSLVYAGGQVVVIREDVEARADSMALDSNREITVLLRGPQIDGRRGRPFTLSGGRIELTGRDRQLRRVLSTQQARAVSEDMILASDTIDLRVADDLLQRAIAWGPSRALAASSAQTITADSIDVDMPGQRVREMRALRGAAAEGKPDSTRFTADTVDWLRGDTIVARFDTSAARDTTRGAQLRALLAHGSARSYYHLAPADSTIRRPAINYVLGREIVVDFQDGTVAKVTVIDKAAGVYLEPRVAAAAPADTSRAPGAPPRATPPVASPRPPQ